MGGLTSQNKGKRGEREVCQLLQPIVDTVYAKHDCEPPKLERNLMQTRDGGFDIVGLEWMALEVKRQENQNLNQWWKQTLDQARDGRTPVLLYRKNHQPWRAVMFGYLDGGGRLVQGRVELSFDTFLKWFEVRLNEYLTILDDLEDDNA